MSDHVSEVNSPLFVCLLFSLVPLLVSALCSVPLLNPLPVMAFAAAMVPLSAAAPPSATAPATRPPVVWMTGKAKNDEARPAAH